MDLRFLGVAALIGVFAGWYISSAIYEGKVDRKRNEWRADVERVSKEATESCQLELFNQQGVCNETQKKQLANCSRTHDMLKRVQQITATCGILQTNSSTSSGYDPASRRFWVDAEAVADLAVIGGASASNRDAAITLRDNWPK